MHKLKERLQQTYRLTYRGWGCLFLLSLLWGWAIAPNHALAAPHLQEGDQEEPALRFGWFAWYPYQYEATFGREDLLTGLDIEMVGEIVRDTDQEITFAPYTWTEILEGLQAGTVDMTVGFRSAERDAYVRYSDPYRVQTDVIYVRRGTGRQYNQRDLEALLLGMQGRFRLGVVTGYVYGPERFNAYLTDPENVAFIVETPSDEVCLQEVVAGTIDGCIVDQTVGASIAWQQGWLDELEELPLKINQGQLYVLFSKASTTQADVDAFNQSMAALREDGSLFADSTWSRIIIEYLHPILISMTTGSVWFLVIDIVGTVVGAISGLVFAHRYRYSIFGAIVLASLPALGGGVTRDLLVGRPPGFISSPLYALLIVGTVAVGYVFFKVTAARATTETTRERNTRPQQWIEYLMEILDAICLGAFTVTGVSVAVSTKVQPLWLWGPFLAVLTTSGGGIVRDVVLGRVDQSSLRVAFYPEVALIWGLGMSVFLAYVGEGLTAGMFLRAVLVTVAGAFITRIVAYWRGWKPPVYG